MRSDTQENLMRLYLLGELPEAEATLLEQQLFTDDEKFEQMWEIENSLVDGYVRGRLSPEDLERFEHHYLASPVHRQRVIVARNLIEQTDKSKLAATIEPVVSLPIRLFEKLGISPVSWQLALTSAMLLFVAGSLWLFIDRAHLHNEIAQLKAATEAQQSREQTLNEQIAATRSEHEKLITELQRLNAERDALAQQSAQTLPTQSPRPTIFSFLLSPTLIRSGGDPQTLTIPLKTDVVRLQMKVAQNDTQRFQASVRMVAGQQIWKQQTTRPHIDNTHGAVITVEIPASKLVLGDYILTLSLINQRGEPEESNRYFFRVIRQ
ncbi:MAG: hypothetical protein AB1489_26615 [Acidobacteriota bacterium]